MDFIYKIYYFFSKYTDKDEKEVGKFLSKLSENKSKSSIEKKVLGLIQKNIIVFNLWTERRYRGYKYLTKQKRKELYTNAVQIKNGLNSFIDSSPIDQELVFSEVSRHGGTKEGFEQYKGQFIYLAHIMQYLSPGGGRYKYRESCTFGELLKDPSEEQLVGDCNQIVTLYIYLFSLRFDISELNIKTYPGHVALHFRGVDIEATNGTFTRYNRHDQHVLPVYEIVSVNLLDTTDKYFNTHEIPPETLLESARLAYIISSEREIVKKNLTIAYNNTVVDLVKNDSFKQALKYAKLSENKELLNLVGANGASYYLKQESFKTALKFAEYSTKRQKLLHAIYHNQGVYYYKRGDYHKAISSFEYTHDNELIKQCYVGLFKNEQSRLGSIKTSEDVKNNRKTIYNMDSYAKKSGNQSLIDYTASLKKYL